MLLSRLTPCRNHFYFKSVAAVAKEIGNGKLTVLVCSRVLKSHSDKFYICIVCIQHGVKGKMVQSTVFIRDEQIYKHIGQTNEFHTLFSFVTSKCTLWRFVQFMNCDRLNPILCASPNSKLICMAIVLRRIKTIYTCESKSLQMYKNAPEKKKYIFIFVFLQCACMCVQP